MKICGMFAVVGVMLALVIAPTLGADAKDDATKKELEKLQGKWSCTSIILEGKELDKASLKNISLVFKGMKVVINGSTTSAIKIDPTKNPAEIDFSPDTGPSKGLAAKGIYKFDGDTVTFCHGPEGGARPKEFRSTADFILSAYKRMK